MNTILLKMWESQHANRLICYATSVKPVNEVWMGELFVINEKGQGLHLSTQSSAEETLKEQLAYAAIQSNFILN